MIIRRNLLAGKSMLTNNTTVTVKRISYFVIFNDNQFICLN